MVGGRENCDINNKKVKEMVVVAVDTTARAVGIDVLDALLDCWWCASYLGRSKKEKIRVGNWGVGVGSI